MNFEKISQEAFVDELYKIAADKGKKNSLTNAEIKYSGLPPYLQKQIREVIIKKDSTRLSRLGMQGAADSTRSYVGERFSDLNKRVGKTLEAKF